MDKNFETNEKNSGLTKGFESCQPRLELEGDYIYYGHGKILLSGEYFVLDGAQGLALPTFPGQRLRVRYSPSYDPCLTWKSYDEQGEIWFEGKFEFWKFACKQANLPDVGKKIQQILKQVRRQNPHFLRDGVDVLVETFLDFPRDWGLGSSSTLLYNIAQWAYIGPFELSSQTFGGSGYDIACAGSEGPILFQKTSKGPAWSPVTFWPSFHSNLFFVHQGKKAETAKAIELYKELKLNKEKYIDRITKISNDMLQAKTLEEFEALMYAHEEIVSRAIDSPPVKLAYFSDYQGEIKSLGAWGGDFLLVSSRDCEYSRQYFKEKGLEVFIPFEKMILKRPVQNLAANLKSSSEELEKSSNTNYLIQ